MEYTYCKAFLDNFSEAELELLEEFSSFTSASSENEINFFYLCTDTFSAEVCLSSPEHKELEIVILANGSDTPPEYIGARQLMRRLRDRKPVKPISIEVE
jgi:hypothetical protein